MPKVSVVMSVYNSEEYLKEAIDSILAQTYTDFEFIILNDGSTDKSEDIIKSYDDERIVYIKNDQNIGLAASLNKGIRLAKGEYIARMDADDISLPKRFEKQVDFLDKNPEFGVLGSWIELFGFENKVVKFKESFYDLFHSFITGSVMVPHPVVMFRRSVMLDNNIFYDESFKTAQDYKLWNELKFVTKVTNLQEILLKYRNHANTVTSRYNSKQTDNKYKVIQKEFERVLTKDFKDCYRLIMENKYDTISCMELKRYLESIESYKNRKFKSAIIYRFFKSRISGNIFCKLCAIFYIRTFMIYAILKG